MKSSRNRQRFDSSSEMPQRRRHFWQPQMSSLWGGGGGPRKPEKKPSKQELAENALRAAVYSAERLVESQQDAEEKKIKAINLAMNAGENFEKAKKRIGYVLRAARRKKLVIINNRKK